MNDSFIFIWVFDHLPVKRRHFSSIEITSSTNSTEANLLRWLSLTFSGSPPLSTRNKLISMGILNSRFPAAQYASSHHEHQVCEYKVLLPAIYMHCVCIQQSICYHYFRHSSLHTKRNQSIIIVKHRWPSHYLLTSTMGYLSFPQNLHEICF